MEKLYSKDALLMNPAYDITERTVTHRLAIYLESYFEKYQYLVDIEYNRIRGDYNADAVGNLMGKRLNWQNNEQGPSYVYPDIIVHKRETNDNLLIIEVKMIWKNNKKRDDLLKIDEYLKEFGYKYGVYIELSEDTIQKICVNELERV
ncbi:hypothetical protein L0P88_01420 [Muricauda sp. SCSIO 64092]|uniref:hypothetical protein n=1 Tax=Allomuricauda sp. SCSIO 64092 TaxID=2908842 RepID=UPI001FF38922|nr:hypothetical protein [Muricauda sp. SCSIO 64092]UOY07224.1 hypothetical protein L0P88_01420 [Muricauda sp. SCSIO 64092]